MVQNTWCQSFLPCLEFEPENHITNKMTYESSEDSDQPGYPPNLIRVFAVHSTDSQWPILHVDRNDSDQTGQMPKLIRVFAGRTGHFVGFVMLRQNLLENKCIYYSLICLYNKTSLIQFGSSEIEFKQININGKWNKITETTSVKIKHNFLNQHIPKWKQLRS